MEETRDIVSVRYNMVKSQFGSSNPYTVAPDVSLEIVTILSENSQSLPGVSIEVTTAREYENTMLIPHIVGRMGKFSSMEDWEQNYRDQGYAFDDSIGISGVESAFESTLRGEDGEKVVATTSMGSVAGETIKMCIRDRRRTPRRPRPCSAACTASPARNTPACPCA